MAGGRPMARDDLRNREGKASGVKPATLAMLFRGGSAQKTMGGQDLRTSQTRANQFKPERLKMLSRGGTAALDERVGDRDPDRGYPDEDEIEALAGGGDVDLPPELMIAAEDVQKALRSSPKDFAKALWSFFQLCESAPHDEAEGGGEGSQLPPEMGEG